MKVTESSARARARRVPELKFEDQCLTSYGGLVVFQKFFEDLELGRLLKGCCEKLRSKTSRLYAHATVLHCLIMHLLLGARQLREMDCYRDDPLVRHALGLERLPSVPTVSRMLAEFDEGSIERQRGMNRDLVLSRLLDENLARVTLDFDGSVLSTTRHAEGSAVGFNKKKKGARSYYPLFCTIAQTGQVLDYHHRSGNVHDSNGAREFIARCVAQLRAVRPDAVLECRMDSAFFSDELVTELSELDVEYTISVPFERFAELKAMIEQRESWEDTPGTDRRGSHFESFWKPDCWERKERFLFLRKEVKRQRKGPLQLDLFEPVEWECEYKVIITNKSCQAAAVAAFHEGRGYQERIFGEIKSHAQMDYVPAKRKAANEVYLWASVIVHNLGRELQMQESPPVRGTTRGRKPLWRFEELSTLRRQIIQRAGRLTRPQGRLTLTMAPNPKLEAGIQRFMN
jgi:hypothetical protein